MTENSTFKNLVVVEIASVLAGPSVGMFFAEMGAKVIKIENKKTKGDVTRSWKLPGESKDSNVSAYFSSVNWHKEHLFMDFSIQEDLEETLKMIESANILIANFKPGDDKRFGLDYESVKSINPSIIYGNITGFGSSNTRVAYDLVLQAETGFMSMNGTEESGPVKVPLAIIDLFAGHQLKEGILTAMLYHKDNPKSYLVEVSLYDAAVASLANQASNWLMAGHIPKRIGSKHPNIAPYGEQFQTGDCKQVTFAIGTDKHFIKLCEVLGIDNLSEDPKFASNQKRVENRAELAELIQLAVSDRNSEELLETLHKENVPAAKIMDFREVFETEDAKKLVLEEVMDDVLTRRVRSSIFKID